jgi:hypothetical protein
VRANACILLGQVGREDGVSVERVPELLKLKTEMRPLLVSASEAEKEARLKTAAAGALQRWGWWKYEGYRRYVRIYVGSSLSCIPVAL